MKIVPLPRSSYVRVKPFGAPPDSYFDFSAFNCQTPMKGSLRVGAFAGRGGGAVVFAGVFAGGFAELCANVTVPHTSAQIVTSDTTTRRAASMRSPRLWRCRNPR